MATPKADFDAVPVIDFALAKTDHTEYFKQLKFACDDVSFGISAFIQELQLGRLILPLNCRGLRIEST
jgi:hypothetical protein